MLRTFRFPLHPNKKQVTTLDSWLKVCCTLYNDCLTQRKEAYRKSKKSLSRYDQQKELTQAREAFSELAEVPALVCRSPINNLDNAYQGFSGKHAIAVNPRGTSQKCSSCENIVKKKLSQRIHGCNCGLILGRDHNAALNILALGMSVAKAEGRGLANVG